MPNAYDPIPSLPPDVEPDLFICDEDGTVSLPPHTNDGAPWLPKNAGQLTWLARRHLEAKEHVASIGAAFDAEIDAMRARREAALKRHTRDVLWTGETLRRFAEGLCKNGPTDRVVTPYLTVAPKLNPVAVRVPDEAAAVQFLLDNLPEYVETEQSVRVAALKKVAASYGALDGVKTWRDLAKLDDNTDAVYVLVHHVDENGELISEAKPVPGLMAERSYRWDIS